MEGLPPIAQTNNERQGRTALLTLALRYRARRAESGPCAVTFEAEFIPPAHIRQTLRRNLKEHKHRDDDGHEARDCLGSPTASATGRGRVNHRHRIGYVREGYRLRRPYELAPGGGRCSPRGPLR